MTRQAQKAGVFSRFLDWDKRFTDRLWSGFKATARDPRQAVRFVFGRGSMWGWLSGGTRYDYARAVGDGTGNSALMAVVNWIVRVFPEAPPWVRTQDTDGSWQVIPNHAMVALLHRPNPWYDGALMWMALVADYTVSGNAYLYKVRSAMGRVVELYWVPSFLIRPHFPQDGSVFIDHYEYSPNGIAQPLDVRDVIHFRFGLDPNNQRLGRSPVAALLRELYTDDEAANFTATILRNLGIPGVIISPASDKSDLTQGDADQIKENYVAKMSGDQRGLPLVISAGVRVERLSFSPEELNLRELRKIPEERTSAIFGVGAMVVGLGAGLDRSTFSNYAEALRAAYGGNIKPTHIVFGAVLDTQLLPDFGGKANERTGFDTSDVTALQEDEAAIWERAGLAFTRGMLMLSEAKQMVGLPALRGDDYYVRSFTVAAVFPSEITPPSPGDTSTQVDTESTDLPPLPPGGEKAVGARQPLLTAFTGQTIRGDHVTSGVALASNGHANGRTAVLVKAPRDLESADLESMSAAFEQALVRYFGRTARDVLRRWKADPALSTELLLSKWDDVLEKLAKGLYITIGETAAATAGSRIGVDNLYDLASDKLTDRAGSLAKKVTNINETTRDLLKDAIKVGFRAGYTTDQIASGVPDDGYTGLSGTVNNPARATMIARTEAGNALNMMSLDAWEASGKVTSVEVSDGDDDEACIEADGSTWTLEEARANPTSHPNCVRRFSPILSDG